MSAKDPRREGGDNDNDHDHDHAGHDHAGHEHGSAPEPAAEIDPRRYEGIDGWAIRTVDECTRELLASLPRARLDAAADAVARDMARKAHLKGFRPGKVPVSRIRALFGEEIRSRSVERLVQDVWNEVIDGDEVRPVANPVLTEISTKEGEPVRFAARFEVLPTPPLQGLAAIAATSKTVKVADADVDAEIEALRQRKATLVDSESREAAPGDIVEIDLQRWAPGERVGEPAEDRKGLVVEVGNEKNMPELDRALLGMAVGETRQFESAVPSGEGSAQAPFRVHLRSVKRWRRPELDEELVRSLGLAGVETVDALRVEIRRRLIEARRIAARQEQDAELVEQLVSRNPLRIPATLVEKETESRVRRGIESLVSRGVPVDKLEIDWKGEFDKVRAAAEKDLRAEWLLELVAREKGVAIEESDVRAEIDRMANESGAPAARVRLELEKDKRINELRAVLRRRRALDLLRSSATISVE